MGNTVIENLQFIGRIKGLDEQRIEKEISSIIATIGLEGHESKEARQLSGGQKRKLGIGMALMGDPNIFIMDEPTSGTNF